MIEMSLSIVICNFEISWDTNLLVFLLHCDNSMQTYKFTFDQINNDCESNLYGLFGSPVEYVENSANIYLINFCDTKDFTRTSSNLRNFRFIQIEFN